MGMKIKKITEIIHCKNKKWVYQYFDSNAEPKYKAEEEFRRLFVKVWTLT